MRILFCNYEYPPLGGGGGVVNAALAQELAKRHEVTVLTSQGLGLSRSATEKGVQIVRVPVFFRRRKAVANLSSMLGYVLMGRSIGKKLLSLHEYDIVNTHFVLPSGPVGDAIARDGNIPHVLSVHGGDLYDPSKLTSPHRHALLRVWIKRLLLRASVVVGQSNNTLENMRRFYTSEIEGVYIPLGIQRPMLSEQASRGAYGFGEDEVLLVTVGRLISRKALPQLLSVMESLRDEKVRLLIVGSGPLEHFLREEIFKRQLEGRVQLMGQVEESEKYRILQLSDIYVSTSQHEGFGLVFLEAMSCDLPVICYDHGGQTDFLVDQETGFLVTLNDIMIFKERCKMLVRSPERRKRMADNNRRLVEEFYIESCALRYENTFNDLIEMNRKSKITRVDPAFVA